MHYHKSWCFIVNAGTSLVNFLLRQSLTTLHALTIEQNTQSAYTKSDNLMKNLFFEHNMEFTDDNRTRYRTRGRERVNFIK